MTKPAARILVVDDEPVNRRLIDAILGPEGHELVHAGTGERALELVAEGGIDLVLLDVMMPGIDGIEVCRRIRVDLQQRLLPIVIVSALADIESRTRGKEVGADDFLTKPIHHDELLARVRNLLLARASYMLSEEHRERAEIEARQWRARSEDAVRASEERHRILFDASPVPSWLFDPASLQILAVNEAMVRLFGYAREELLAM